MEFFNADNLCLITAGSFIRHISRCVVNNNHICIPRVRKKIFFAWHSALYMIFYFFSIDWLVERKIWCYCIENENVHGQTSRLQGESINFVSVLGIYSLQKDVVHWIKIFLFLGEWCFVHSLQRVEWWEFNRECKRISACRLV